MNQIENNYKNDHNYEIKERIEMLQKHISELQGEIQYRDRRIEELEAELKIKAEIIRKQVVLMGKSPSSFC